MIRNRLSNLLWHKRRGGSRKDLSAVGIGQPVAAQPILWQNDYYHFKGEMMKVGKLNTQIGWMVQEYGRNPSVYLLKQLDGKLTAVCRQIDKIEYWSSHFPYSRGRPTMLQMEQSIVKHFRIGIMAQIRTIFQHRQKIAQISNWATQMQQHSFSHNHSMNRSMNHSFSGAEDERSQVIREVGMRIDNLNIILSRMGDLVQEQGELVNRIDDNLKTAHHQVKEGRGQLQERENREWGEGEGDEFSCAGRVNAAITGLYVLNLVLIVILVVKNL